MPSETKIGDITVGIGSHGNPCCPHSIVGVRIMGSGDVFVNALATSRVTDIASHDCPHCPINMCIMGSPDVLSNALFDHRLGDSVCEGCGTGASVTGSVNTFDNG